MTEKTGTEISEVMDNDFKYSKDDICKICGVSERTFSNFLASQILTEQDFISVGARHKKLYKENVLKQFQAWLMKNQINQGIQIEQIKNNIGRVSDIENFKYSKEDICNLCGVSDTTFERFLASSQASVMEAIAERDFIIVGPRNKHYYNENVLKQFQAWLMKNQINQGVQVRQVKANVENNVKLGLSFQEIVASGNIEAMRELTTFAMNACAEVARNKQLEAEKKALEEKGKQLMLDYQNEKKEHQKDKELVLHKYLTATQIKDAIWKEYGKRIIVSKIIKRIPIEDNDILYKPFMNGNYTGQQPVYHPNVLDKICEIME